MDPLLLSASPSVGSGDEAEEDQFSDHIPPPTPSPLLEQPLPPHPQQQPIVPPLPPPRKPKKKSSSNNSNKVWTKPTSRKKPKRNKSSSSTTTTTTNTNNNHPTGSATTTTNKNPTPDHGNSVLITPVPRFPDRSDDSPFSPILLSRSHKAERVDLSDDRLSACSTKGYRMVRATRGVLSGSWYFEIRVLHLGPTGHVRLGWVMDKVDLQAPVGYDRYGYGYRDVDGSKVHRALREPYGEEAPYGEGDVIGFYVNLPEGGKYAPKMPQLVWYKGQRYMYSSSSAASAEGKDDSPKVVPGSEISFFKNGVCQGVAFTDLVGGRYYPAASMYTLPNQPNCEVRFNFGPNFEVFPEDFGGRPIPRPMSEVPYHGYDVKAEEPPMENGFQEKNI